MTRLLRHGMIAEQDLGLFDVVDTLAAALTRLGTSLESDGATTAPSFARCRSRERSNKA